MTTADIGLPFVSFQPQFHHFNSFQSDSLFPSELPTTQSHNQVSVTRLERFPVVIQTPDGNSFTAETIVGNGTFGVVFGGRNQNNPNELIAIKRVLQDKRYKNRELMILKNLSHPNIIALKSSFFSQSANKFNSEIYLNLVLEYVPETMHRVIKTFLRSKQLLPLLLVKLYTYQLARALAYLHAKSICHRDVKPQNVLVDQSRSIVKLCDFGSAKYLSQSEPNVSYICSRYYRAPELILAASLYTTAIDIWSLGCIMAEMLLGVPLFHGDSAIGQMVEIIQVLGTPSEEEMNAMNPKYPTSNFYSIAPRPWTTIFRQSTPSTAYDLISKVLVYNPQRRLTAIEVMAHPFFDELRAYATSTETFFLPSAKPFSQLLDFSPEEIEMAKRYNVLDKLLGKDLQQPKTQ